MGTVYVHQDDDGEQTYSFDVEGREPAVYDKGSHSYRPKGQSMYPKVTSEPYNPQCHPDAHYTLRCDGVFVGVCVKNSSNQWDIYPMSDKGEDGPWGGKWTLDELAAVYRHVAKLEKPGGLGVPADVKSFTVLGNIRVLRVNGCYVGEIRYDTDKRQWFAGDSLNEKSRCWARGVRDSVGQYLEGLAPPKKCSACGGNMRDDVPGACGECGERRKPKEEKPKLPDKGEMPMVSSKVRDGCPNVRTLLLWGESAGQCVYDPQSGKWSIEPETPPSGWGWDPEELTVAKEHVKALKRDDGRVEAGPAVAGGADFSLLAPRRTLILDGVAGGEVFYDGLNGRWWLGNPLRNESKAWAEGVRDAVHRHLANLGPPGTLAGEFGLPDPKPCPKCNKQMIAQWTGLIATTSPAQKIWEWWCGCGHSERGGAVRERTPRNLDRERWERANA